MSRTKLSHLDIERWLRDLIVKTFSLIDRETGLAAAAFGTNPDDIARETGRDISLVRAGLDELRQLGLIDKSGALLVQVDQSEIEWRERSALMLAEPCRTCKARPLDPCRSNTGKVTGWHKCRRDAVDRADAAVAVAA